MNLLASIPRGRLEHISPVLCRMALCLLLGVVVFLAYPAINREVAWYDEGIYLTNAQSLASGLGYRNANLPGSPGQGRNPPLLPFLLSLIWRGLPHFPDNLPIMKSLMLLVALAFLTAAYAYLRTVLGMGGFETLAAVAVIAVNPLFVAIAPLLASEYLYALLSLLALYSYDRSLAEGRRVHFGLVAVFASLAFLTRSVGVALLAAVVAHLALRRRLRPAAAFAALSAVTVVPWIAWSWATLPAYAPYPLEVRMNYTGYTSLLGLLVSGNWMDKASVYLPLHLAALVDSWGLLVFPWRPGAVWLLFVAVGVYALVAALVRQPRLQDLYCALLLLVLVLSPGHLEPRFLLVLTPFLVSYVWEGITRLLRRGLTKPWPEETARKASRLAIGAVAALAVFSGVTGSLEYRATREQTAPIFAEFRRMLGWIEDHTPADAILVGDYDRAYYLFTGRKAIRLSHPDEFAIYYPGTVAREFPAAPRLLEWFKRVKACYLIRDPMIGGPERLYFYNLIEALKRASPDSFAPIYSGQNEWFAIYKIGDCPEGSRGGES